MAAKKAKAPAKARGKKGTAGFTRAKKMEKAIAYVAKAATSPQAASVATEVGVLKTTIAAVTTLVAARPPLVAALSANEKATIGAESALDTAMTDYVQGSTKTAGGDADVLAGLGVDVATLPTADTGPAGVVTGVTSVPGALVGTNLTRWKRPGRAGAFLVQYKLEPGSVPPGSPAPEWTPSSGHPTSHVEWTITGLPAAADLRVRVCAIGAQVGPWSEEVLGKAR